MVQKELVHGCLVHFVNIANRVLKCDVLKNYICEIMGFSWIL